jgi:hypothetical protein
MKKLVSIIVLSILLPASAIFASGQTKRKNSSEAKKTSSFQKKSRRQQEKETNFFCQLPASVTNLELNQTEIVLSCPTPDENCINNQIIKVTTTTVDIEDIKYVYVVSAGKIIGEGANVEWDLSDAKSGTYTITAGISQPIFNGERWEVLGKTQTKTVVIKE